MGDRDTLKPNPRIWCASCGTYTNHLTEEHAAAVADWQRLGGAPCVPGSEGDIEVHVFEGEPLGADLPDAVEDSRSLGEVFYEAAMPLVVGRTMVTPGAPQPKTFTPYAGISPSDRAAFEAGAQAVAMRAAVDIARSR